MASPAVWSWRPSQAAWFAALRAKVERWTPTQSLGLHSPGFADRVARSCANGERWLVHPSANAVVSAAGGHRDDRDFAFVAWAARNVAIDGGLELAYARIAWTPDGGAELAPGTYALSAFAADGGDTGPKIAIDPWCASSGVPVAESWAARGPATEAEVAELTAMIRRYCEMLVGFERLAPACFAWALEVTRVAVPLRPRDGTGLHSYSREDFPGLVVLDVPDDLVAFVELLVHESAHHHLFMADVAAPLIEPGHDGQYRSPLRNDPRPLRGVLLAYHALAYICAAYRELGDRVGGDRTEPERARMAGQLAEAHAVIAGASEHLTDAGRAFVRSTEAVADYGAGDD